MVLSLDSINERFHKIDQCFRCASIGYFYSVIASVFIDSEDEVLKINQVLCLKGFLVINIDSVQYFFDMVL
jgi:hypothetical protein